MANISTTAERRLKFVNWIRVLWSYCTRAINSFRAKNNACLVIANFQWSLGDHLKNRWTYSRPHLKRVGCQRCSSQWEFQAGLPRAWQQLREEPALLWLLPYWLNHELCAYCLKPLFHMDNHIEWITVSYMWNVFQEETCRSETFEEEKNT